MSFERLVMPPRKRPRRLSEKQDGHTHAAGISSQGQKVETHHAIGSEEMKMQDDRNATAQSKDATGGPKQPSGLLNTDEGKGRTTIGSDKHVADGKKDVFQATPPKDQRLDFDTPGKSVADDNSKPQTTPGSDKHLSSGKQNVTSLANASKDQNRKNDVHRKLIPEEKSKS